MKTQNLILAIFALVLSINSEVKSQSVSKKDADFINVQMNILLNGAHKKDNAYHITIMNLTLNEKKTIDTSNKTALRLDYNTKYEVTVSYDGYNTKIVEFDTNAPVDKWIIMADVDLSKKNNDVIHAGRICFDKESKTFKSVKKI